MKILDSIYQDLVDHAFSAAPEEACGLIGIVDCTMVSHKRLINMAPDRQHHFRISAEDLFVAHTSLKSGYIDAVATYHSHPRGDAEMSTVDVVASSNFMWHLVIGLNRVGEIEVCKQLPIKYEAQTTLHDLLKLFNVRYGIVIEEPLEIVSVVDA